MMNSEYFEFTNSAPGDAQVMSLGDFTANVKCGAYTDYDGVGFYAVEVDGKIQYDPRYPIHLDIYTILVDATEGTTHVVWFNS